MEIITKSKFMALKNVLSNIKMTLLWPFPILQAAVQKK